MLLAANGLTLGDAVEVGAPLAAFMVAALKGQAIWQFLTRAGSGQAKAAVNSAAVDVVELLRTEVGELRTQLAEVRTQNLEKDRKITSLETSLRVLREEITGEAPIRALAERIEGLTATVTEGINALLERKDGAAA